MKRPLLAFALLLASCFESHDPNQRKLTSDDCYACHEATFGQPDVQKTHAAFAAPGGTPPTTCGDCHETTAWKPALGGAHPVPLTYTWTDPLDNSVDNDTFLIADFQTKVSPHKGIKCLACHDLSLQAKADPPERGYNANCTQCHPNDSRIQDAHVSAVRTYPGVTYAYTEYKNDDPTFCRACHPEGLAVHHPVDKFRLPHGEGGSGCYDCHRDRTRPSTDGLNTDCVTCHGFEQGHHDPGNVQCYSKYRSTPPLDTLHVPSRQLTSVNFCLACHSNGHSKSQGRKPDGTCL